MVSGIVVMLCVGLECLKIQNESLTTAKILGLQEADVSWKGVMPVFGVLEHMANVFFTIELLLRLGRRLPGVVPPLLQRLRVHHSRDPPCAHVLLVALQRSQWRESGLHPHGVNALVREVRARLPHYQNVLRGAGAHSHAGVERHGALLVDGLLMFVMLAIPDISCAAARPLQIARRAVKMEIVGGGIK